MLGMRARPAHIQLIALGAAFVRIASVLQSASAQKTTAVCLSNFSWMFNSLAQSPCVVASYLEGACTDTVFSIAALPANRHYVGPSDPSLSTPCICSTVSYSLVSACGICQGSTATEKWSAWITNCSTANIDIGGYPRAVPSGTAYPAWALQDVVTPDTFDPNVALSVANQDKPDTGPNGLVGAAKKSSPVGAIVGGVVGGILFLGLVGVVGAYLVIRARRARAGPKYRSPSPPPASVMAHTPGGPGPHAVSPFQPQPVYTPSFTGNEYAQSYVGHDYAPAPSATPRVYDPSNPATFPGQGGGIYGGASSVYATSPQPVPYGHQPQQHYAGAYTGAAEI